MPAVALDIAAPTWEDTLMKQITLTELTDDRTIVAIKNLRAVTGLGLKESKMIVDRMHPQMRSVETITVPDSTDLSPLDESFKYVVPAAEKVVPGGLVLEFVLDVLSYTDPAKARAIMDLPSYRRIREDL